MIKVYQIVLTAYRAQGPIEHWGSHVNVSEGGKGLSTKHELDFLGDSAQSALAKILNELEIWGETIISSELISSVTDIQEHQAITRSM
jgi:hypothetical protein